MAAKWPMRFETVIAFHPSLGTDTAETLKKVQARVLLQWIPADMFHPWKKWTQAKMNEKIENLTVEITKIHPWHADCAKQTYKKFSTQVCLPVVKFLTGKDPIMENKTASKAREIKMVSATGSTITGRMNITFAHDVTEEEMEALMKQPDINQEAINVYK